jgi:hypothetical protein
MKGSVMVPMRDIFEAMGATVEWIPGSTSRIIAHKGLKFVEMLVSNVQHRYMFVNGKEIGIPLGPILSDGHTLVPARAVSEALDATVEWKDGNVIITTNKDGYDEFAYVPDFGKMFNVELQKKTIQGLSKDGKYLTTITYYYRADKSPKNAIEDYIAALTNLGFVNYFSTSTSVGMSGKTYENTEKGVVIMPIISGDAYAIAVMVPMDIETLKLEATN